MYLKTTLLGLFKNRYLIKNFMLKDLKNRYSGSVIGFIWSIIHPLTLLAVYSVVFSWLLKMRVGEELGTTNFSIWLFAGLLPWMFFAETLGRSTTVILDNSNLIKKTVFPSEILPISILLSHGVNFVIGLIILLSGLLFIGGQITLFTLSIFIYIFPLVLFALGFSWLTASLNVFFRDIGQLISVILNIWFYATTILYPISVVPEKFRSFFFWNPLTHVIDGIRDSLLKGAFISVGSIVYLYISAIIVFIFGQYLFQMTKKGFVDVI